ncbi:hypothetical protein HDE_00547 [Halotydeus destructor]|nr:hypothetical protein HDE_00547 [Halotydeus destructor]
MDGSSGLGNYGPGFRDNWPMYGSARGLSRHHQALPGPSSSSSYHHPHHQFASSPVSHRPHHLAHQAHLVHHHPSHHTRSRSYRGGGSSTGGQAIIGGQHLPPSQQAALCRCGSGGALPQSPPPGHCGPGGGGVGPSYRAAHSLPSTPNALRRPLSPAPHLQLQPTQRPFGLDLGPPGQLGIRPLLASGYPPGINPSHPEVNGPPSGLGGGGGPLGPQQSLPPGGPLSALPLGGDPFPLPPVHWPSSDQLGPVSDSAALADQSGLAGPRGSRALNQWAAHSRNLRYRTSSRPLMKFSTLVIIVIAIIIIGFIVLSPLFHYFM